jgi:hypothetical protein
MISGAPARVHIVDISALFIAFVIPGLIAINKENKNQLYVWLFGAIIGLLYWNVLSSYVIVKREIFTGWYIVYPVGVIFLLLFQLVVKYINSKLPYNKSFKMDATKRRGAI